MESLKEIFDAMNSRVRSPIFGSIAIAFLVINWKPIYYLLFANESVEIRFEFFDANTTLLTTVFWPPVIGIAFAVASSWIAFFSAWIAETPTTKRKLLQTKSADRVLTEKLRLEQTRKKFLAAEEKALIEEAKRDEEVQEIKDPTAREQLEERLDQMRRNMLENGVQIPSLEALKTKIEILQKERNSYRNRGMLDQAEEIDIQIKDILSNMS